MVTAFVPLLTGGHQTHRSHPRWAPNGVVPRRPVNEENRHSISASISSELTITPAVFSQRARSSRQHSRLTGSVEDDNASYKLGLGSSSTPPRLAGLVGVFTGCGALLALSVFLPLPPRFSKIPGISAGQAVADSYYVVGTVALAVGAFSFFGLRNLVGEEGKGWRALLGKGDGSGRGKYNTLDSQVREGDLDTPGLRGFRRSEIPYWKYLWESVALGFRNFNIGLGYLGGFVAR